MANAPPSSVLAFPFQLTVEPADLYAGYLDRSPRGINNSSKDLRRRYLRNGECIQYGSKRKR